MGRRAVVGVILAALAAGAGGGVAIAATQGTAKHVKTPVQAPARPAAHHCHNAPSVAAL